MVLEGNRGRRTWQDVAGRGRTWQDFLRPGGERRSRRRGGGVLTFKIVLVRFANDGLPRPCTTRVRRIVIVNASRIPPGPSVDSGLID